MLNSDSCFVLFEIIIYLWLSFARDYNVQLIRKSALVRVRLKMFASASFECVFIYTCLLNVFLMSSSVSPRWRLSAHQLPVFASLTVHGNYVLRWNVQIFGQNFRWVRNKSMISYRYWCGKLMDCLFLIGCQQNTKLMPLKFVKLKEKG